MDPTPAVVAVLLAAVIGTWGWISEHTVVAARKPPVAEMPVVGLVRYCAQVSAALEASPSIRASASGAIALPASAPPTGGQYANWASGPPAYTLQCWLVSQPAGGGREAALAAEPGNPIVGIAQTPALWSSTAPGGQQQAMPKTLTQSEVGTVVVLTGY